MKLRQIGFSLIELLFTVTLMGILASLAIPSFRTMLVKRTVSAASDALVSDMRLARSEALKRSARTVICVSSDGATCAGVGSTNWQVGWIVFVDMNSNGSVDAGDDLVKVQQAFTNISTIQAPPPGGTLRSFNYEPTGWAKAATQTFVVTPTGTVPTNGTRMVCVSITGRPALRAEGTAAC
jgi:type IV fimbrial biogenesis protein FimT